VQQAADPLQLAAAFTLFLYVALLLIAVGAKQNDFYFAATVPNFNL
jgi:hypothetical protein